MRAKPIGSRVQAKNLRKGDTLHDGKLTIAEVKTQGTTFIYFTNGKQINVNPNRWFNTGR